MNDEELDAIRNRYRKKEFYPRELAEEAWSDVPVLLAEVERSRQVLTQCLSALERVALVPLSDRDPTAREVLDEVASAAEAARTVLWPDA